MVRTKMWSDNCIYFYKVLKCKAETAAYNIASDIVAPPLVKYQRKTTVPSLLWGIQNENKARTDCVHCENYHTNFSCVDAGLQILPQYPYLAASPDGVVYCECCGKGTLEIKCPFKHRNVAPHEIRDSDFCLDSNYQLKESHSYFFKFKHKLLLVMLSTVTSHAGLHKV